MITAIRSAACQAARRGDYMKIDKLELWIELQIKLNFAVAENLRLEDALHLIADGPWVGAAAIARDALNKGVIK